jgi:hypothetical protein
MTGFLLLIIFIAIAWFFSWLWAYFWTKLDPNFISFIIVRWTIIWWWYISYYITNKISNYLETLNEEESKTANIISTIIIVIIWWLMFNFFNPSSKWWWTCYDKTSYDYNWQNDMKCINWDWKVIWTDYNWAKKLLNEY